MDWNQLQIIQGNRLPGETIDEAKSRLIGEGKLSLIVDDEGFMDTDLIIPRWKICQPTSRMKGAEPGHFINTISGETRKTLEKVVFLKRNNGRVLFQEDDFSGNLACWSRDGVYPAIEEIKIKTGEEPKSNICDQNGKSCCPFAQWNGNVPPLCKQTIGFIGLDSEMSPFWIAFHGTGIPPTKRFLGTVYLKKKQKENVYLRSFEIDISLQEQVNSRGKYFVPNFENTALIENKEKLSILNGCFQTLQHKMLTA